MSAAFESVAEMSAVLGGDMELQAGTGMSQNDSPSRSSAAITPHDVETLQVSMAAYMKRVVERYEAIGVDVIAGLDARGFILGPPIALAMKKPFVMMRKGGKMPNL